MDNSVCLCCLTARPDHKFTLSCCHLCYRGTCTLHQQQQQHAENLEIRDENFQILINRLTFSFACNAAVKQLNNQLDFPSRQLIRGANRQWLGNRQPLYTKCLRQLIITRVIIIITITVFIVIHCYCHCYCCDHYSLYCYCCCQHHYYLCYDV